MAWKNKARAHLSVEVKAETSIYNQQRTVYNIENLLVVVCVFIESPS
jgi:hypothetical protein